MQLNRYVSILPSVALLRRDNRNNLGSFEQAELEMLQSKDGFKYDVIRLFSWLFSRNTKHRHFRCMKKYGNYCVIIGSKYSQKIRFDSNFNRIFNYVHGTHCLTWNASNQGWLQVWRHTRGVRSHLRLNCTWQFCWNNSEHVHCSSCKNSGCIFNKLRRSFEN